MQDQVDDTRMMIHNKGGAEYDRLTNVEEAMEGVVADDPCSSERDDDDDDDEIFGDEQRRREDVSVTPSVGITASASRRTDDDLLWWNRCLLPDDGVAVCGVALLDGPPAVKLVKFVGVTITAICAMHQFVRAVVRVIGFYPYRV